MPISAAFRRSSIDWSRPSTFLSLLFLLFSAESAVAAPVGVVASVIGKVKILRSGKEIATAKGLAIDEQDQIITSEGAAVKVVFFDGSNCLALAKGSVKISEYYRFKTEKGYKLRSIFEVVRGKARYFVKPQEEPRETVVKTGNAILGIRGTTFLVDKSSPTETNLYVETGTVSLRNAMRPESEIKIHAGEKSVVVHEAPPAPAQPLTPAESSMLTAVVAALPVVAQSDALPPDLVVPVAPPVEAERADDALKMGEPQSAPTPAVTPAPLPIPTATPQPVLTPKVESKVKPAQKSGMSSDESLAGQSVEEKIIYDARIRYGIGIPYLIVYPRMSRTPIYKDIVSPPLSSQLDMLSLRLFRDWQISFTIDGVNVSSYEQDFRDGRRASVERKYVSVGLRSDYIFYRCRDANLSDGTGCLMRGGLFAGMSSLSAQTTKPILKQELSGPVFGTILAYESWPMRFLGYGASLDIRSGRWNRLSNDEGNAGTGEQGPNSDSRTAKEIFLADGDKEASFVVANIFANIMARYQF